MILFRHHCGWGQNTYIDNINIDATNTVGVLESEQTDPILTVYPNPVSENSVLHIHSDLTEEILVEVYSTDGKRIYRKDHDPVSDIQMSEFLPGAYVYVLSSCIVF